MTTFGILLFCITIIGMLVGFALNYLIGCYKWVHSYYLWLPVGLIMLTYFVAVRWVPDLQKLINLMNADNWSVYEYSVAWSKVLLLDMCPLAYVLLSLSLILDRSRSCAKVVSLVAIIGGLITMFSFLVDKPSDMGSVDIFVYIFQGTPANKMYFMMHFLLCVIGFAVYLECRTYTKYSFLGNIIFLLGFIAYVNLLVNCLSIRANATGMVEGDWYQPSDENGFWYAQYEYVYKLLPIAFPYVIILWYGIAFIVMLILMYIKNRFTLDNYKMSPVVGYWHELWKRWCWLRYLDQSFEHWAYQWYYPRYMKYLRPNYRNYLR